jgi:hypothetical protein
MNGNGKTIAELHDVIVKATKRYEEAHAEAMEASRKETTLLNELNGAQKELDVALLELKAAAPHFSDWKSGVRRAESHAVANQTDPQ